MDQGEKIRCVATSDGFIDGRVVSAGDIVLAPKHFLQDTRKYDDKGVKLSGHAPSNWLEAEKLAPVKGPEKAVNEKTEKKDKTELV